MQRFAYTILVLGFLGLIANCTKEASLKTLSIQETRCSDPWGTNQSDSVTEIRDKLTKYLKSELNVTVVSIEILALPISIYCPNNNCNCQKAQQIHVTVEEGYVPILVDNGFILIE